MLSVQVPGFEDMCLLTQHGRLYAISVRQASVLPSASFRFHLTVDTLAVRLAVPPAGSAKDLTLRAFKISPSSKRALPGAHKKGVRPLGSDPFFLSLTS
jgi:hypothetical protein